MDLSTEYLGLDLRSPLIASAGPLTSTPDGVRRLAEAGVGAVVLPSLFEEQLAQVTNWDSWPHRYLYLISQARAATGPGVPVIASLNGVTPGGWTSYATAMEDAGAAAIELNIYYLPDDPLLPARDAEQRYTEILLAVRAAVRNPSALLRHGPGYADQLLDALEGWMRRKGFTSVAGLRGLLSAEASPTAPGRTGYLSAIEQATHAFGGSEVVS